PHLALRDTAGSEVQQERLAPLQRYADAAGIGAKAAVGTAPRRNRRARQDIDEMNRHESLLRGHLSEVPDSAEVMRDGQRHGLFADHLAVAALPVQRQERAGIEIDLRTRIGLQSTLEDRIDVAR